MSFQDLKKVSQQKMIEMAERVKKENREHPKKIYTEKDIRESKHPEEECLVCGQLGCDMKYLKYYLHNKCMRILIKEKNKLMQ